jgi:protein phosphatase
LLAARRHCVLLWVGDSRIYRLRQGALQRLSHDHSKVQDLVDRGLLSRHRADTHPAANVITRAVGANGPFQVDARICEVKHQDRFLLCTDGLTGELREEEIARLLAQGETRTVPQTLIEEACKRGARDNVTAVAIEFHRHAHESAGD